MFNYPPEHVRKALSKERLGGTCLINLCAGGETLLARETVNYARELLSEGHYVMIVTNGTVSKRFDEFASFPKELKKHLFFKFSYHYLEFKKEDFLMYSSITLEKSGMQAVLLHLNSLLLMMPFLILMPSSNWQ